MKHAHATKWIIGILFCIGIHLGDTTVYAQRSTFAVLGDEAERLLNSLELSEEKYGKNSIEYADELQKMSKFFKHAGFRILSWRFSLDAYNVYAPITMKLVDERSRTKNKALTPTIDYLDQQRRICLRIMGETAPKQLIRNDTIEEYFIFSEYCVSEEKDPRGWSQCALHTARYYRESGKYEKAKSKIREAQKITARRFPKEHYRLMYELGLCHLSQNHIGEAEKIFLYLREVAKEYKETDYLYGATSNQLATISILQNRNPETSHYLQTALAEYQKSIPILHQVIDDGRLPYQLTLLCNTANAYDKMKQPEAAALTFKKSLDYLQYIVVDEWSYLYTELEELWQIFGPYFENIKQFALRNNNHSEAARLLYDVNQISKSLFSVPPAQKYKDADLLGDAKLRSLYNELLYVSTNGEAWDAEWKNDNLGRARSALKVYASLQKYLEHKQQKGIIGRFQWPSSSREIINQLSDSDAIINFFTLTKNGTKIYYAQIISQDNPIPVLVTICGENILEKVLNTNPESNQSLLYRIIWQPLQPYVEKKANLYIASDGLLHTVSYASLKSGSKYLIDTHYIYNLLTFESLNELKAERASGSSVQKIFLFGGVDFTAMPENPGVVRGQGFHYLPGSRREIQEINTLVRHKWKVESYSAQNATEKAFRDLVYKQQVPNVIHISTHGFYLPQIRERNKTPLNQKMASHFYDPLIRTGFALSGANIAWEQLDLTSNPTDGVLTALEIEALELRNTQLVVLSACNTGVGKIKDGEGVFGLQRAFRYAGVNSMIVTLWEIPDKEAAEFMKEFYSQWSTGRTKRRAFMDTQKKMRTIYPNDPMLWGGFQLIE